MPNLPGNEQPQGLLAEEQQRQPAEQSGRQPTPEQQQQLQYFLEGGSKIIQSPKTKKEIVALAKAQDPRESLAKIIVPLLGRLEEKIDAKMNVDLEVVAEAGRQLLEQSFDIIEQSGGEPFTPEERFQGFSMLVSTYLQDAVDTGKISDEEYAQLDAMMRQTPEGQAVASQLEGGAEAAGPAVPQAEKPRGQPAQGLLGEMR
jgi:hypothetical protein